MHHSCPQIDVLLARYNGRLPRYRRLSQVFKDFLQVLSILQVVLHGWQSAAAVAMSSLSFTPLSTKAWISLDCLMPRTDAVGQQRQMYNIAAQVILPGQHHTDVAYRPHCT
jgi:hypothetical protein